MKFSEFLKETPREKALDVKGFLTSLNKDGVFTLDGSHLRIENLLLHNLKTPRGVAYAITSLQGLPENIYGSLYCRNCPLKTLKGGPRQVKEVFEFDDCELTHLDGAPEIVGGYFSVKGNNITSLKNIHKHIKHIDGNFYASNNPIMSHVLGLLRINGIIGVDLDNRDVTKILNKYLPNIYGNDGVFECQQELIDAGYENFAQL